MAEVDMNGKILIVRIWRSHELESLIGASLGKRAYRCSSHSRLSRGQTLRVLSQREMQWKWNAC